MEPAAVIAPDSPSTATINDLPDDLLGRVLALAGRRERWAWARLTCMLPVSGFLCNLS